MVLTLNNFIGFETGAGEELSAFQGTFDDTLNVITGGYAARAAAPTDFFEIPFLVSPAGNDHIIGFHILQNTLGASSACVARDSAGNALFTLRSKILNSLNSFDLEDSNGTLVVSGTIGRAINQKHYIEIYWQNLNAGNAELFVNNVSEGTGIGDFDSGNALSDYRLLRANPASTWYDDVYIMSGANSATDRLNEGGGIEVLRYQGDASSNSSGNALDVGSWVNTQDTPANDASLAAYTGDGKTGQIHTDGSGTHAGPNGDGRINGSIAGAKWMFRARRTNGSDSSPFLRYGRWDGSTFAQGVLRDGIEIDLTTSFQTFAHVEDSSVNTVPRKDLDYFRLGMGKGSGGRDIELAEAWGMLLHVPSGVATFDKVTALQAAVKAQRSIAAQIGGGISAHVEKNAAMQSALARVVAVATDLDGTVQALASAQADLDGLLKKPLLEALPLEAIIRQGFVRTSDLSGFLVQGAGLNVSLGTALEAALAAQVFADAALRSGRSEDAQLEAALLQRDRLANASLDSFLRQTRGIVTDLEAVVRRRRVGSLETSSALAKLQLVDAALTAALATRLSAAASADAVLQVRRGQSADLAACLEKAKAVSTTLEAFLQAPGETSLAVSADVALRKLWLLQAALDTALLRLQARPLGTDAALRAVKGLTGELGTAVRKANFLSASLDGAVSNLATAELPLALASLLMAGKTATASLAAAVSVTRGVTATLDGSLRAPVSQSFLLGGYLAAAKTSLLQLDAFLARAAQLLLGLDAALRANPEHLFQLDAVNGTPDLAGGSRIFPVGPGGRIRNATGGGRLVPIRELGG